jgi:hypothetical protein
MTPNPFARVESDFCEGNNKEEQEVTRRAVIASQFEPAHRNIYQPGKTTMTLTIYGSVKSRTMRVLWAAAELRLA